MWGPVKEGLTKAGTSKWREMGRRGRGQPWGHLEETIRQRKKQKQAGGSKNPKQTVGLDFRNAREGREVWAGGQGRGQSIEPGEAAEIRMFY